MPAQIREALIIATKYSGSRLSKNRRNRSTEARQKNSIRRVNCRENSSVTTLVIPQRPSVFMDSLGDELVKQIGNLPQESLTPEALAAVLRSVAPRLFEVTPNLTPLVEIASADRPAPPLPHQAPALWAKDKQPGETPPEFIKRHYEPWLGKGLTRAEILKVDRRLYTALANWRRSNVLPEDFVLPTLKEHNDLLMAQVRQAGSVDGQSVAVLLAPEQTERLLWAMRARQKRANHEIR